MSDAADKERQRLAVTLSRAFRDDPAFTWILGGDSISREVRLRHLFAASIVASRRIGYVISGGEGTAASLWRRADQINPGLSEYLFSAWPMLRCFGG